MLNANNKNIESVSSDTDQTREKAERLSEMVSVVFTKSQIEALTEAASADDRKLSSAIRVAALRYYKVAE